MLFVFVLRSLLRTASTYLLYIASLSYGRYSTIHLSFPCIFLGSYG